MDGCGKHIKCLLPRFKCDRLKAIIIHKTVKRDENESRFLQN